MGRKAFLDPATKRLKAHGFVETNEPGDLVMDVTENFALNPSDGWQWDGAKWKSFPFPKSKAEKSKDTLKLKPDTDAITVKDLKDVGLI